MSLHVPTRCENIAGKFMSDMILLKAFLSENNSTRNSCFELWKSNQYYSHWKPQNECLLQALQCVPMSNYASFIGENSDSFSFYDGDQRSESHKFGVKLVERPAVAGQSLKTSSLYAIGDSSASALQEL
jgi:hypothetical protein